MSQIVALLFVMTLNPGSKNHVESAFGKYLQDHGITPDAYELIVFQTKNQTNICKKKKSSKELLIKPF